MSKPITVQERVAELVREHGSYRAAGEATGVSFTQLHGLATGRAIVNHTRIETIRKLGLRAGPKFERA